MEDIKRVSQVEEEYLTTVQTRMLAFLNRFKSNT